MTDHNETHDDYERRIKELSSRLSRAEKLIEAQHAARNALAGDINLGMATLNKELQGRLDECRKFAKERVNVTGDMGQPGEATTWQKLIALIDGV